MNSYFARSLTRKNEKKEERKRENRNSTKNRLFKLKYDVIITK